MGYRSPRGKPHFQLAAGFSYDFPSSLRMKPHSHSQGIVHFTFHVRGKRVRDNCLIPADYIIMYRNKVSRLI